MNKVFYKKLSYIDEDHKEVVEYVQDGTYQFDDSNESANSLDYRFAAVIPMPIAVGARVNSMGQREPIMAIDRVEIPIRDANSAAEAFAKFDSTIQAAMEKVAEQHTKPKIVTASSSDVPNLKLVQ